MRTLGITLKMFGHAVSFRINAFKTLAEHEVVHYGSSSNFGKWKTAPYGLPVSKQKTKRKKK